MGRALLTKLLLLAALAGLIMADGRLDAAEDAHRAVSSRVERLVPPETKKDAVVAAVTLRRGDGDELLYARSGGVWRCRTVYNAVADWQAIQGLVDMLLDAEGTLQTDVTERFGDYGIGGERGWHVGFHGPGLLKQDDRDTFFQIELGDSLPALDGGFVRLAGEDVVRVIERDPRRVIQPLGAHPQATPLLDPYLVPRVWLGPGDRMTRVQIDRVDGVSYALELRTLPVAPGMEASESGPAMQWVLVFPDGSEQAASPNHAIAYTVFLSLVRWAALVDPARAVEVGMERLSGRVVLGAGTAPPMILAFGPASADELVPVANDWAQSLVALPKEVALLYLPRPEELAEGAAENPWEPWLVEASRAMLEQR